MARSLSILFFALLGSLALVIVVLAAVIYTGAYDVSAAREDPALLRWVLVSVRESSVQRRAQDVQVPVLEDEARLSRGFRSYREMCVVCHGRPGGDRSPLAKGLNPGAPDLSRPDHDMPAAELFWVVKNGIRMTGMPAWGRTHSDEELWDLVAFVKALPNISAAQYDALDRRLPPGHDDDHHDDAMSHHDEGEPHAH